MKKSIFVSTLIAATAMAVPAFAADLTWGGSSESWTAENAWSGTYTTWVDGSDAIFGSGESTVTVTGTVTAGSVTIEEGGSYTFNIDENATLTTGTLTNSGSLAITGGGTVKTGYSSDANFAINAENFSGTLEITSGRLDVANSNLTSSTKIVLDTTGSASELYGDGTVSLYFGNASGDITLASSIELSGEGGAMIRTGGKNVTISGSVTGATGSELQKNGAGSLTFTDTVSLDTYINYQDNTTFAGETTIGTLEFTKESSTSSSVTFTHDASVGAITVESNANTFTDSLTVSNSATLTVGSISLGADTLNVTTTDATNGNGTLVVTGNISVGSGKLIIGEDSTVTATGATADGVAALQGIAGEGTLSIEGDKESTVFTVTTDSSFTGTVDVQKGYLRVDGTSIADTAKLVLQASAGTETTTGIYENTDVSIQYGADGATLAHDITVSGTGGVIIRSQNASYTGTFSGNISGESAAYLQLNGGGSAVFTGSVTLTNGGYINYQGTTTFTNKVTLGSLAIYQTDTTTTSTVTFTGSDAAAEIGTLTLHSSEGTNAINLAVSDGASLSVGTLEINHDVAIAIDNATMSITTSATQTSGTSTSITISNGGTLNVGDSVELNNATINIVLGEENLVAVSPDSLVAPYADSGSGVYALTGGGSIGDDVSITITVDEALKDLLAAGGEYTIYVYEEGLNLGEGVTWDTSALENYGISWNGDSGTISVGGLPEPELFSVFLGISALGMMATRRRRRRVA